jgi:hypothetical protein
MPNNWEHLTTEQRHKRIAALAMRIAERGRPKFRQCPLCEQPQELQQWAANSPLIYIHQATGRLSCATSTESRV